MKLSILCLFVLGLTLGASAQEVDLDWKLQPEETVSYLTVMTDLEPEQSGVDFSRMFTALSGDSGSVEEGQKLLQEMNEALQDVEFVTRLKLDSDGAVDIVMRSKEEAPPDASPLEQMAHGLMLRGSVNPEGDIHSFWLKSAQKNLISLLFELPTHAVKVGDSWPLEVNLISNDQNFDCRKAEKSVKATLVDLKEQDGQTVAVIKYDVLEFVEGVFETGFMSEDAKPVPLMMKFTHQAVGEFSVERGRWLRYDGLMTIDTTGVMDTHQKKRFALIPE